MTPDRWQRLKEIYGESLSRPAGDRAAFLESVCAGDVALRAEVEQLLSANAVAQDFLSRPAVASFAGAAGLEPGVRLGPYAIVKEVGRGGMGILYLAERADQAFSKRVAIKVLSTGLGSDALVGRFHNERQILAGLAHPNIATLLDGGTTPDGAPYLVMEFVEGEPLDRYCEAHRSSVGERLDLFLRVCAAVQYAHQNMVVHRDLKPGNILVTPDGQPKLLDFGIAKLLPTQGAILVETSPELRFLTPAFASPEQFLGRRVTALSDVYSLGALLYLLLTGRRHHESDENFAAYAKAVTETQPRRPSSAAPPVLARQLAGDLDAIVLKALRPEPAHRYASVEQFAEDIRRHLAGLPVEARRGGTWYRTGRFLARHRAASLVAAAVLAVVVSAYVETARERARAERRFSDVRAMAHSFLFEVDGAIKDLPGSLRARRLVVERAQQYLEVLERDAGNDISLRRELATAYERLAEIQGDINASLGDAAARVASLSKAVALWEPIVAAHPEDMAALASMGTDLSRMGSSRARNGDQTGARRDIRRAIDLLEPAIAKHPEPGAEKALAIGYDSLGLSFAQEGDLKSALAARVRERELFEKLALAAPGAPNPQRNLALGLKYEGAVLEALGRSAEASAPLQRAVEIDTRRLATDPNKAMARMDLGYSLGALADHQIALHQLEEALVTLRRALELREETAKADPADEVARMATARAQRGLAAVLMKMDQPSEAYAWTSKAQGTYEQLVSADSKQVEAVAGLGNVYAELGDEQAQLAQRATDAEKRGDAWRAARDWYAKSEVVRARTVERGWTLGPDLKIDGEHNAQQLARCNQALSTNP